MRWHLPQWVVGAGALAVALWLGTPAVLRRLAFFRVRQVELVGVQHLPPEAVLAALRLPARASVFDDTRRLADRVEGLPGVAVARVVRRLPAALKVIVREEEPVAFVPGPRGAGGGEGEALWSWTRAGGCCRSTRRGLGSTCRSRRRPIRECWRCWR